MKAFFAMAIVLLFAAGCAHHQRHHKCDKCAHKHHKHDHKHDRGGGHWMKMDTDKNGAVTQAEFDKFHAEIFKGMDANKDGKVTMEEKKAFHMSKKKDKDCGCNEKDGATSESESSKATESKKTGS